MAGKLPQDNNQQLMQSAPTGTQLQQQQQQQQQHLDISPTLPEVPSLSQPSPNMISPKILSSSPVAPSCPPSDPNLPQNNRDQDQVLQPILPVPDPNSQQSQKHQVLMQPKHVRQMFSKPQPTSIIEAPIISSSISPTSPQPATAIKKGRFRVVKGTALDAAPIDNHPVTNDDQDSLEMNLPHDASTVKRGRFVVKKATAAAAAASKSNAVADAGSDVGTNAAKDPSSTFAATKGLDYASDTSLTPTKQDTSSSKQKGRFLVKTRGSTANCQAVLNTAQQNAADNVIESATNVNMDQSDGDRSNHLATTDVVDPTSGLPAGATKKKGRFVIKRASVIHPPPELNATVPAHDGIQNLVPLTNPNQIAGHGPVHPVVGPTTASVNVTGQVAGAPNGALTFVQALPQQPLQQNQVPHTQTHSQLEPSQSQPNAVDTNLQITPPATRRAATDDRASDDASSRYAENIPNSNPLSNRLVASLTSNSLVGSRGKTGHMIGNSGGVGKLLHYLETLRSEVIEADRNITSLQSDKRFLVSRTIYHLFNQAMDHLFTNAIIS